MSRRAIYVYGALAVIVLGPVLVFGSMLLVTGFTWYWLPQWFGAERNASGVGWGAFAGVVVTGWITHRFRAWVQRLRLRRLRTCGVRTRATITFVAHAVRPNPRGPDRCRYTVTVTFGATTGERVYPFWGRHDRRFEARFRRGARVPVVYPAGRPQRFVIDLPYAASLADQFV